MNRYQLKLDANFLNPIFLCIIFWSSWNLN